MPINGGDGNGPDLPKGEGGQVPVSPDRMELLREYLEGAPEELSDWAGERLVELDGSVEADTGGAADSAGPEDSETSGSETEESDDFYNDMEGEDDLVHDRMGKRRNRGGKADNPELSAGGMGGKSKVLLALVLVVGVIGGVYVAGQGGDETPSASTPTMNSDSQDSTQRKAELADAIEENPEAIDERLELGVLYFNDRDIEQAQEQWLKVTELEPEAVAAWYNLGFSYLSEEPADTEAAYAAWERVIDIDPDSQEAQTVKMHMEGLTDPVESPEE